MRPPCLVVLMLALVTMVSARSLNAPKLSYMEILKQRFYNNNGKYLQNDLILRDTIDKRDNNGKYRSVTQCIFFRTENQMNSYNKYSEIFRCVSPKYTCDV